MTKPIVSPLYAPIEECPYGAARGAMFGLLILAVGSGLVFGAYWLIWGSK